MGEGEVRLEEEEEEGEEEVSTIRRGQREGDVLSASEGVKEGRGRGEGVAGERGREDGTVV